MDVLLMYLKAALPPLQIWRIAIGRDREARGVRVLRIEGSYDGRKFRIVGRGDTPAQALVAGVNKSPLAKVLPEDWHVTHD